MLFSREDWKLFRNIETLSQKAGVERNRLPLLIIKELVDNALDVSETCNLSLDDAGMVHNWLHRLQNQFYQKKHFCPLLLLRRLRASVI